ncbi:DUF1841 family protein [Robbsia sp. Bb-Pol-6]|uniref:DUF1841 family protein n=1 Tax=Robbsia betulipollinis TaxID=2981849 RepID=A0ABT3ZPV0_9BURK|nr:DUF1841 family protein [Robbsia betulipollinis]MCY0388583.1 DUF1841 family protein [Robbsia betulipollinis]
MFNPSREEVRQFFCAIARKQRAREILTPLETIAADWIVEHPEYRDALDDADEAADRDYTPEQGQSNPFLHLSMHLAISEQVSIDQPPGIRLAHERLAARLGSSHAAQHQIMDCLGETLWEAQRSGAPLDSSAYIERIQRRATHG